MGWPWFGKIQIKIVDPDNPDQPVRKGQQGVAVVRGKSITTGYLGDEDQYQRKWHKGWWNTGDVAYLDKLLRIKFVDRNADKFGDRSLTHMESVLLQQLSAAQEIILLPVAHQELVPVAIPNAGETEQLLEQWALVDIPGVTLRDPVLVSWDQVPLTSTWKIRRRNLMQKLGLNTEWIDRRYA
ncbi:AMP-binding protein [Corynebacterium sp. MSK297]|uniref:AMP-binding protein n=1 Tax=Corynebacterium sp. MSK297 TaxID=3050221 RepID=UPI00254EAD24|nr:AMP-binding protein [Corynebacterium sp. MSK297]MDK8846825.1 AMP-binding protein [Corynebacterium sp. MSK297]